MGQYWCNGSILDKEVKNWLKVPKTVWNHVENVRNIKKGGEKKMLRVGFEPSL